MADETAEKSWNIWEAMTPEQKALSVMKDLAQMMGCPVDQVKDRVYAILKYAGVADGNRFCTQATPPEIRQAAWEKIMRELERRISDNA